MRKISKIEPTMPTVAAKKKVAGYARISMESERMHHSLSAQISYYNALIQKKPEWEFAGVYADDGISGTGTAKRTEFLRMLADCEAGKIDIILTKSIQRFARNTVDLLETVRHLKNIGVEVRFEKENINSMSGDGELMLSILASFAQEESRSISENVKWGTRKRFEQGIPNGHFQIYGYRWEGDQLVAVPEEATVVKRIFQNFVDGKSRLETERELEEEGIRTRQGCVMRDSNLKQILTNVTYTGNMLLQKEFIEDPINKKRRKNHGELPQYWVENTHEAIIDMEIFQYVQDEMERRRQLGALANKSLNTTCFTGKIKCPYCNQSYMHNLRTKNGHRQEYWSCGSKKKKKIGNGCPVSGTINHKNLKKACAEVLGITEFDETVFLEEVDHIDVPKVYTLVFYMKDGTVIEKACPNTGHQDCWTAEYRARISAKRRKKPNCRTKFALTGMLKCTECGCNFRRCTQPSATSEDGKFYYWRCAEHGQGCKTIGMREDYLKQQLAKALDEKEWNDAVIQEKVDHINVSAGNLLQIIMKDGSNIDMTFFAPKKKCRPKTEEEKAHMRRLMKERWTPELKQQMSNYMKNLRKERGDKWRKEK